MLYTSNQFHSSSNIQTNNFNIASNSTAQPASSSFSNGLPGGSLGFNNTMMIMLLTLIAELVQQLQGGIGDNGQEGNAGNNSNHQEGNTGNSNNTPEVSINIPPSTGDNNTVQFRNANGSWQTLNPNQPPEQELQPSDIRLVNNSQGTIIGGDSAGARITHNENGFSIGFEDRFNSNAPNDNDFNDVRVTIRNSAGNNDPAPAPAPHDCATSAPTPAPTLPPVGINDGASTWGDPHFVGAEGGKYDVQGEDGKTYNILSDKDVQINSEFRAWKKPGSTVMGKMGITLGNDKVAFDEKGNLSINGEKQGDGSFLDGAVKKDGDQLKIEYGEYKLTIDAKHANGMDIAYASDNVAADGVMPHGLWGQTADGDGKARNGDKGSGAQGGGAIEGLDGEITERGDKSAVSHYEVGGLFDTSFTNFNRFGN